MGSCGVPPARAIGSAHGYEQYSHDVYGWAYRLLGRHHDALDVVQDVFLKWNRQCAHETPKRPRGWLRRVTVNLAIDLRRRRAGPLSLDARTLSEAGRDVPASIHEATDRSRAVGDAIDREALRDDIAAALNRLTESQRTVLVAKVYDEMTFAAIAAELDLSVSTAKTHYLRAVRAVRDRLEPRWAREK